MQRQPTTESSSFNQKLRITLKLQEISIWCNQDPHKPFSYLTGCFSKGLSRRFLNVFTFGADITFSHTLFHELVALVINVPLMIVVDTVPQWKFHYVDVNRKTSITHPATQLKTCWRLSFSKLKLNHRYTMFLYLFAWPRFFCYVRV